MSDHNPIQDEEGGSEVVARFASVLHKQCIGLNARIRDYVFRD
jgi:hypothetical protein